MLMIDIFYIESNLEMEHVHAEDAMREIGEGQKVQNIEHQKSYQGRKYNEMTSKEQEEDLKRKAEQQKEYRKEIGRNDNRRRRRTKKTKGRSKQRISKKKV